MQESSIMQAQMNLPVIAIVGRPNVGKSTLFNCFAKRRKAIISDIPGTTRDSLTERVQGENYSYWLVDTAGLTNGFGDDLEKEIQIQAELATKNADIIVFLIDGNREVTADDEEIVQKLRRTKRPIIFVANKIDDGKDDRVLELTRFGFGMPLCISAKNFTGMWELEDRIDEELEKIGFEKNVTSAESSEEDSHIKLAFIGRPNVGKSSIFNALLKENRSVVSSTANTTRDTIDTEFEAKNGTQFLFLDTAGLRRPGRIGRDLDYWSSVRTAQAIERSDVCALLIDAVDGVTHQDAVIAGQAVEAGKGLIVVVNKFDLVQEKIKKGVEKDEKELKKLISEGENADNVKKNFLLYLTQKIPFVAWAPVVFCSAKTGKNVDEVLLCAEGIAGERKKRITTSQLNVFMPEIYKGHVPPSYRSRIGKIKLAQQVDTCPPKFIIFVNNIRAFHTSYQRYIENKFREKYGFNGTPLIVELRDSKNE